MLSVTAMPSAGSSARSAPIPVISHRINRLKNKPLRTSVRTSANHRYRRTGQAEARMSTFEPTISSGTKSLVRKRPELQAPFEQRRAMMDAKRQERERLRQAARVGGRSEDYWWAGEEGMRD